MIGRLTGRLASRSPQQVVLEAGGVGYEVQVPLSTYYPLAEAAGDVTLHVHTHVREDALQLFGFWTLREREVFRLLLGISGVGPRMGLAILSGIPADELARAVEAGDRARLQRIPGVGRKTAERLLLELRERADALGIEATAGATAGEGPAAERGTLADAISALTNLGYAYGASRKAVRETAERLGGQPSLQELLREALQVLSR